MMPNQIFADTQRAVLSVARATRGLNLTRLSHTVTELLATKPAPPPNERDALVITGKLCDALLQVQALLPELEQLAERLKKEQSRIALLNGQRNGGRL